MQSRFGHDFSRVRVHRDRQAAASAQALDAAAYTVGHDIVFGPGQFEPETTPGRRLIAHELTHVSQIELAGDEGRGEQWLAEGMAEWVAYSTLERLGLDSLGRRRLAATSGLRSHATLLEGGLDLETHGTPRGFTAWHTREGGLATYQLAFFMADYLIERRGFDRLKTYFTSFKDSNDRRANFEHAFSETIADFEADVLAYLRAASAL